jgi:hypothetical protein
MSSEVSKATENFFLKYGRAATSRSIVGRLLKFNKFGEYKAGQEEEEIKRGTKLAAAMDTLQAGFVLWQDNRPVDAAMGRVVDGFIPPKRETLGHLDKSQWESFDDGRPRDPWQFTNEIVFVDPETGELFTFSTSSRGGLDAIGQLCLKHGEHIRQKPDEVPIIALEVGSYQHSNRAYGEIRFPIFKIVGHTPTKDLPSIEDEGGEPQLPPPDGNGNSGGSSDGADLLM